MSGDPPSRAASAVDVACSVAGAPPPAAVARWTSALVKAAAPRRASHAVSVLLCGDARMRRLNREWRRKDRSTDVLSFPSGLPGSLGDVVVSVPYASRQARARGHARDREIRILLAHGVLHLLGYDHETDDGEMFRRQRALVRKVFGPGPDGVPEGER